jgi:hypothetical protein
VAWRLVSVLFICNIAAYLDRVNIGFAKPQMKTDLKSNDKVCGLGAGNLSHRILAIGGVLVLIFVSAQAAGGRWLTYSLGRV